MKPPIAFQLGGSRAVSDLLRERGGCGKRKGTGEGEAEGEREGAGGVGATEGDGDRVDGLDLSTSSQLWCASPKRR